MQALKEATTKQIQRDANGKGKTTKVSKPRKWGVEEADEGATEEEEQGVISKSTRWAVLASLV